MGSATILRDIIIKNGGWPHWPPLFVNKGLKLAYDQTIFELKYIETIDDFDQKKKSKATSILQGI